MDLPKYCCINCNARLSHLYKQTDVHYIKIIECAECGSVADRYVECEMSVVLMDVALLDVMAFRHVLHNSGFAQSCSGLLKLFVCIVLSEGYHRWARADPMIRHSSTQEINFYAMCLLAAIDLLIYSTLLFAYGYWTKSLSGTNVVRCVVLSASGCILHVPAAVWGATHSSIYCAAVTLYCGVMAVQALRGSGIRALSAFIVALSCAAVTTVFSSFLQRGSTALLPHIT